MASVLLAAKARAAGQDSAEAVAALKDLTAIVTAVHAAAPSGAAQGDDCDECGGEGIVTRAFATPHDVPCPKCAAPAPAKEEDRG